MLPSVQKIQMVYSDFNIINDDLLQKKKQINLKTCLGEEREWRELSINENISGRFHTPMKKLHFTRLDIGWLVVGS